MTRVCSWLSVATGLVIISGSAPGLAAEAPHSLAIASSDVLSFSEQKSLVIAMLAMSPDDLVQLSWDRCLPGGQRLVAASLLHLSEAQRGRQVLLAMTRDVDPLIRDLSVAALAGTDLIDADVVAVFRGAALSGEISRQFGGVMGLLRVGGEENLALVDEVYRAPGTSEVLKVEIAKRRARRGDDFDRGIAFHILYSRLADPHTPEFMRWSAASDLAQLGERSEILRWGRSLTSDDHTRIALLVLRTAFPRGPRCEYTTDAAALDDCLCQWRAYSAEVEAAGQN